MNGQEWTELITVENVAFLHRASMTRYGTALAGPPEPGCVEGALGNAWSAELYLEETPNRETGLAFAGFVLFYLVRNHCFTDGNKRVAWLSALWILARRGLTVVATTDESDAMLLDAIAGGPTITSGADVTRWLADHLAPLS